MLVVVVSGARVRRSRVPSQVVNRSATSAEFPVGGTGECGEHEGFGVARRVGHASPEREAGADRRRQRTSGAVIVRGRHALSVKDKDFTVTDQDVGGAALGERALREMAPFDEDPGRTEAQSWWASASMSSWFFTSLTSTPQSIAALADWASRPRRVPTRRRDRHRRRRCP